MQERKSRKEYFVDFVDVFYRLVGWTRSCRTACVGLLLLLLLCALLNSVDGEEYRIQPNDVLEVTVLGEAQYNRKMVVLPDGTISYPRLGVIKVQGMTVAELEKKVRDAVSYEIREPKVSIVVTPRETPKVYVVGAVNHPGPLDFVEGQTVVDYVSKAGGPMANAWLERVILTRAGTSGVKNVWVNLKDELSGKPKAARIEVGKWDTIYVPIREGYVYVLGEVNKPGPVEYKPELKLSDYIGLAGGPTPNAWLKETQLTKSHSKQSKLDLSALSLPGGKLPDVVIEPNDTIYIPENLQVVYVEGEVNKPGPFPYRPDLKVSDYIGLANGPTANAWLRQTRIYKYKPVKKSEQSEQTEIIVDMGSRLKGVRGGEGITIEPGDRIYVPTNDQKVNVAGEVNRPGSYPWREGWRIADYLGEAGGVAENAWLEAAVITRASSVDGQPNTVKVDLSALLTQGKAEANLELEPGDTLTVPRKLQSIYVGGEVVKPGPVEYHHGWTVADYLGVAGGPTETALLSQAILTREVGGTRTVRILNLEQTGEEKNDLSLVLESGDTLTIPKSLLKVNVVGEVNRPGAYNFYRGLRLSDYLAQAGGVTQYAKTSDITITRGEGANRKVIKVDLGKALKSKDATANPVLEAGDVVVVPQRGVVRWMEAGNLLDSFFRVTWMLRFLGLRP